MTTHWLKNLGLDQLKLPTLEIGAHEAGSGKLCAMEMVAFIERLPHSDRPECTCPIVGAVTRYVNDTAPTQADRQALLRHLPRVVGTVAPEFLRVRQYAVLQAVFDLAVGLRWWDLRWQRHADGTRVAYPPWHYGPELGQRARGGGFGYPPHVSSYMHKIYHRLYVALSTGNEEESGEAALHALGLMRNLDETAAYGPHWLRQEVIRAPLELRAVRDGTVDEALVQCEVRDYRPTWSVWNMQLLEHVLAIGPAGRFTAEGPQLAERVHALAELA